MVLKAYEAIETWFRLGLHGILPLGILEGHEIKASANLRAQSGALKSCEARRCVGRFGRFRMTFMVSIYIACRP